MARYCVLVMGPAGSGKSTLCTTLLTHMEAARRRAFLMNLDPAAENFEYRPHADIRTLVSVDDVMQALELGPNGALVHCMEYLLDNVEWLDDVLGVPPEDDYWIIDCPGQIELYCHSPLMRSLVNHLRQRLGFNVCAMYCVDSGFVGDPAKYFSACLTAMSAMVQLEAPHLNVLTKIDLLKQSMNDEEIDRYLWPDTLVMDEWAENECKNRSEKWKSLNRAVAQLLDMYDMVAFSPLDISSEDSIATLLEKIDFSMQYGEDEEPAEPKRNAEDYDY